MKLKIRYENTFQTLDVDLEEMWVMLSLTGEEGMSEQAREKLVQETMDIEFNRPEYNNWHKFTRRWFDGAKPKRLDGKNGFVSQRTEIDKSRPDAIEFFPDEDWEKPFSVSLEYEDVSNLLHSALPKDQADLLIRVHVDGYRLTEIAEEEGVTRSAICHRLRTAENNFKKVFPRPSTFPLCHG